MENLNKLTRLLGADRLMTAEDVQQILLGIMEILKSYKEGTESINEDTKAVVNSLLEQTIKYNQETISDFKSEAEKAHAERMKELQTFLSQVKITLGDMEVMMSEVKDGKDADEERVIDEVINRIKIDPTVVTMSPEEIRDKLASLKDEERLDKSAIKGLEKVLQQKDLDYAVATLQHQASFLINKGGLKTVSHDATLSGDGTPESPLVVVSSSGLTLQTDGVSNGSQTLLNLVGGTNVTLTDNGTGSVTIDAAGGSGSPGGSNTQVQFNDSGSFGGDAGLTYNKTTDTLTVGGGLVVDTSTLAVDATNNRVGIGTASPGFTLHAVGSTSGGFAQLERTTSATTNLAGVAILKATSSGDMADTFGTQLAFNIEDTAAVSNQIALIAASRAGADNTGNLDFYTANAGTVTSKLKVSSAGVVSPATSDASSLGSTSLQWSDLFLAEGGVINFDNGDVTLTQTGNTLNLAGGNLVLTDQTASQVAILDASKHLIGADTATYPSLTELSYVKGVTSAIQTQINAKGNALTSNPLSQFASTTSAQLAGVISDETGSGSLVFGTDPTFTTRINAPEIKATGAGGLDVHNNSGTQVALFGAGGSTGTSLVGTTNIGSASADYIQIAGNTGSTTQTATGSSTNININLVPKGTGRIQSNAVNIPTVSSTDTLTNKTIRNTVEPGTDDTYTGEDITGFNATATIAQWDAVYLSTTGWALTDADAASTAGGVMVGLAAAAGTSSNPLTVVTRGIIRNDGWTWTTVGAPLYLSTTAGALTETAPSGTDDVVRIVGYVMSDDCIFFNPSNDWITRV